MAVSDTTSFITEEPTTDVETIDGVVTEEYDGVLGETLAIYIQE
jgi:hypothetical protein